MSCIEFRFTQNSPTAAGMQRHPLGMTTHQRLLNLWLPDRHRRVGKSNQREIIFLIWITHPAIQHCTSSRKPQSYHHNPNIFHVPHYSISIQFCHAHVLSRDQHIVRKRTFLAMFVNVGFLMLYANSSYSERKRPPTGGSVGYPAGDQKRMGDIRSEGY